ncbi:MAG: antitoxin VapB family protein [Candidatus Thermoplasmatota archaeon]
MSKYKTISVPEDVKRELERAKNGREWGDFLKDLYEEAKEKKSKRAFEELVEGLSKEELDKILESSDEFRRGFELR